MIFKILLVCNESATCVYLKSIIEQLGDAVVVATASNGTRAMEKFERYRPQVVFIDLDIPDMKGLEIARMLSGKQEEVYIVFVTAYHDYALQTFELNSFDYIVKSFNEESIKNTLLKLKKKLELSSHALDHEITIPVDQGEHIVLLKPSEILYIESQKPKIYIKSFDKAYTVTGSLLTMQRKLEKHDFFRCHRGYLVNLHHIKEIIHSGYTYQIILLSGDTVLLSRKNKVHLLEKIHAID